MVEARLQTAVFGTALALMVGWLVYLGQEILLPVMVGLISVYVLATAADGLGRVPVLGRTPLWLRRSLVLLGFIAVVTALVWIVVSNVQRVVAAVPGYEENLIAALTTAADFVGLEAVPSWERIREVTIGRIDLQQLITTLLSSTTSLGGQILLIVLYTIFLVAERVSFHNKLLHATTSEAAAERLFGVFRQVNQRIGEYLAIKTLVNVLLGIVSFIIMWGLDIDFALFWAVIIALFNYIPYFGSLIGVLFPVGLSLAQFGSWWMAFVSLLLLTAAQVYVGNFLEPRLIGRSVNLSPLVVLIALSVWTTLWGLPGAILAIPLTSMLVIILAAIDSTRPVAIMLSSDGNV